MDFEFALAVLSRIVHVTTAIVLIGGSIFTLMVLLPAGRQIDEGSRAQLLTAVIGRWKRFVHLGILLFLASGIYNYMLAIPQHRGDGPYHAIMGTKMLLALVVFFIAAALVGRSAKLEAVRRRRSGWLSALTIIALVIVAISGFLKIRGVPSTLNPEIAPDSVTAQPAE